jgi:hypothetical protein
MKGTPAIATALRRWCIAYKVTFSVDATWNQCSFPWTELPVSSKWATFASVRIRRQIETALQADRPL